MCSLIEARRSLGSLSLVGIVALAACDNQSTSPEVGGQTPTASYDRSAYVEPPSVERQAETGGSGRMRLNVISTLSSPNVIVNGSFETGVAGSFAGWTIFNQELGSGSWYIQSGTLSPLTSISAVPAPTDGTYAAMTDQISPGSHILYQDVTVPAGASLSYDLFIGNRALSFLTPSTLSYVAVPNQQARVDIMTTGSAEQDVTTGVILNLYQTAVGNPLVSGYTSQISSLASLAGQTVRLRFSEVDNGKFFQMGIDNVSLRVTYTGLCASIQTLVSKAGIRQSLCNKLSEAAVKESLGDSSGQNGVLGAFINQVEAQTGKSITAANAALLISAAQDLMAP